MCGAVSGGDGAWWWSSSHVTHRADLLLEHEGPRLVELAHRLRVVGEHTHPLAEVAVVEAAAHKRAELDVRVVLHPLVRVHLLDRRRQRLLGVGELAAARLPRRRRVAALLHEVPDVPVAGKGAG